MNMSKPKALDSIRVAIRVRPMLKRENGCKPNWQVEDDTIYQLNDGKKVPNGAFTFDRIFDKDMATINIYMEFAKSIVISVMEGINGTLFAYGQTSSGKTYTMTGDENCPGIIHYSLSEVFDYISQTENREFLLRVSYMEIYNELITDLLKPKHTNLKIHENAQKEVFVGDLTEKVVTGVDEIFDLMKLGERNRHFGCTNMNEKSSRSHTIFRMVIESRETSRHSMDGAEVDGAVKVSHLNLVDLAGSERAAATGSEGIRLREGGFINKSLFALANVINKLSEGESTFVPFRDSKLTRILQTSLGGNAKTSIICAVTTASNEETLSTLQFASRAKTIKNRPEVNEVLDDTALLKRYRREINELKRKLEQHESKESVMEIQMEKDKMEQLLKEQRQVAAEQREKMRELANFFCTAQTKDTEKPTKRNKRRWTVCPMGVKNKPPLHLVDLPSSFDHGFMNPNKKLKPANGGVGSDSCTPQSSGFNQHNLDKFFTEIDEREEDFEDVPDVASNVSVRRSCSLTTANTSQEKRCSFAENDVDGRIKELEMELKSVTEERDAILDERDAIRNDLSDNITTSCEIQADLVKTKQVLRQKSQKILELQENLVEDQLSDKKDEEQISTLKESLLKEQHMLGITEATLRDLFLAKENIEKELEHQRGDNEKLRSELQRSAVARDESAKECHRLCELTQELEGKVDVLTVVQSDLEAVDVLQEELEQEQEKNGVLENELSQHKDACDELREELKRRLDENSEALERKIADHEETLAQTNKKFHEATESIRLLEEQNSRLHSHVEELRCGHERQQTDSEALLDELKQRVQELEYENASLTVKKNEVLEECSGLQEELANNAAIVQDLKSAMQESAKTHEGLVNEKTTEVTELEEKLKMMAGKLARKKRRASCHSSIQKNASAVCQDVGNVTTQTKDDRTPSEFEDEAKVSVVEVTDEVAIEVLEERRNSLLVHELEELKQELQRKSSTIENLETNLSAKMCERSEVDCASEGESNVVPSPDIESKKLEVMEEECREMSVTKMRLEEELRKATTASETLKKQHEDEMESLRSDLREELVKRKTEVDDKLFVISALEVRLSEELAEQQNSDVERARTADVKLQMAAILEEKSSAIEMLEGRLEDMQRVAFTKDSLLKENEELVSNLQKELVRNDSEFENSASAMDKEVVKPREEQLSSEIAELKAQLEEVLASKETFAEENGERMADLKKQFEEELEIKRGELDEKSREIVDLQSQLEEVLLSCKENLEELEKMRNAKLQEVQDQLKLALISKEQLRKEHEDFIERREVNFHDDLNRKDAELECQKCVVLELQKKLDDMISSKEALSEDCKGEIAELQKTLEKRNSEVQERVALCKTLQEKLETLVKRHDADIASLNRDLDEELQGMQVAAEEKTNLNCVLEAKLKDAIASRDSMMENKEKFARLREELELNLQTKSDIIDEKDGLITSLGEQMIELGIAKDFILHEHGIHIESVKKDLNEELEKIRATLEEKSNFCVKLEEEITQSLSANENLASEHEVYINGLKDDFRMELERLNEERSRVIDDLQEKLTDKEIQYGETIMNNEELRRKTEAIISEVEKLKAESVEKTGQINDMETELAKVLKSVDDLTTKRDGLRCEYEALDKELNKSRLEQETKCGELTALEKKTRVERDEAMRVLNEENNMKQEELQRKNQNLEGECEKLKEELQEQKADGTNKGERIVELKKQFEEFAKDSESSTADCGDCRRKSSGVGKRRESLLFKSMLEDIKEEVSSEKEDTKQNKLIDELSYTLMITQEKLEQKEFVIDEKEIEMSEKDVLVEDATEKVRESQEFVVAQEAKLAELQTQVERVTNETAGWQTKLENAEADWEKARAESEELVRNLRGEMNELHVKLAEYESILNEEQLKELYNTMQEKATRITELEHELCDVSKKDQKICELEMDVEVLQGKVSSWQKNSEEKENKMKEFKDMIKDQEEYILQLEASKVASGKKSDERCNDFVDEKKQRVQVVKDKNKECEELKMELEVLQSQVACWEKNDEEAQGTLEAMKNIIKGHEEHIAELKTKAEKKKHDQNIAQDLQEKLQAAKSRLNDFENEKNRGLKILKEKNEFLDEYEQTVCDLEGDLNANIEELKEVTEKLDEAVREREELEIHRHKAVEEIEATKAELKHIREAHHAVSSEFDRAKKQMSDRHQSALLVEQLRQQLVQAKHIHKEEQGKRCSLENVVDKQQITVTELKKNIEELKVEVEKSRANPPDCQGQAEMEKQRIEWEKKEGKMKERIDVLEDLQSMHDKDHKHLMNVIDEEDAEIEGYKERISQLESEKSPSDAHRSAQIEGQLRAQLKEQEEKMTAMKKRIDIQEEYHIESDKERKHMMNVIDTMDAEEQEMTQKIEDLRSENESLAKRETEGTAKSLGLDKDISSLKFQIKNLESEVKRPREASRVDLEGDLQKVRSELKAKDLDLYHITYQNSKQMDNAKSKIRELERERANYLRKNNELRTEIRMLHNQDDQPTVDVMKKRQSMNDNEPKTETRRLQNTETRKLQNPQPDEIKTQQPTSRCVDDVGVVGSVALLTLDTKVVKLQKENVELKQKSENLQHKNAILNNVNVDLKQRNSQLSDKYNKLKEQYTKIAEPTKPRDHPRPRDHQKARDQKPPEPMQPTIPQESRFLSTAQPAATAVGPSVKESHVVARTEKERTVPRENKENLLRPDTLDTCKTQ